MRIDLRFFRPALASLALAGCVSTNTTFNGQRVNFHDATPWVIAALAGVGIGLIVDNQQHHDRRAYILQTGGPLPPERGN